MRAKEHEDINSYLVLNSYINIQISINTDTYHHQTNTHTLIHKIIQHTHTYILGNDSHIQHTRTSHTRTSHTHTDVWFVPTQGSEREKWLGTYKCQMRTVGQ